MTTDIENLLAKASGKKDEVIEQLSVLAKQCEEKLGILADAVFAKYEAEFNILKKVMATNDENIIASRTYAKIKGHYNQELRSPALTYTGMVLGVTEPFDMVRSAKRLAAQMWDENKDKAIAEGYCNAQGEALDIKATYANGNPNKKYGTPLPEHSYIRNVIGICQHEGQMTLFSMMLGDRLYDLDVKTMTPVTFRANPAKNQNEQGILSLNPYSRITFEPTGADSGEYLQENARLYEEYTMQLGNIQSFHNANSGPRRFCIAEGDVMYIDYVPNPNTGNKMMVLEDETLPPGHNGITCFIPGHINIDFGSGSRVVICGQTTETNYQAEEGEVNYIMNITGLFAIPELKVPCDEVPQSAVQRVN